ncbi:protein SON-like isoform X1 [Limulus polyphemus]|uniref:Protein SON-like isoform X1 n=1 Tax=Limulus polyphemus TaxID=6850 RepID=A0ABM1TS49_LIMPO|nr:protein SON-like isoform X1 [Limulus polyphemus]
METGQISQENDNNPESGRNRQCVMNSLSIQLSAMSASGQGLDEGIIIRVCPDGDNDSQSGQIREQRRIKSYNDLQSSTMVDEISNSGTKLENNNKDDRPDKHPQKKDYLCIPPPYTPAGQDQYRRHSMEIPSNQSTPKKDRRKRSCPETEFYQIDCLTPSSLRSSASGSCHSRRSSCADKRPRRHSRTPRGSITTLDPSRRPSKTSRGSVSNLDPSRRSSKASRGSDAGQDSSRRPSRSSRGSTSYMDTSRRPSRSPRGSVGYETSLRRHSRTPRRSLDERKVKEEEHEPVSRRRRIIIGIICSVFFFILITSIGLVAATLSLSPRIDQLVRKENQEIYRVWSSTFTPQDGVQGAFFNQSLNTTERPG